MADKLTRTIKAVSSKNLNEGSIGFLTIEEDKRWYNVTADPEELEGLLKVIIQKGNKIEFEVANGYTKNLVLVEKAKEDARNSDDMTSFEDLLADAHTKFNGQISIKTELIQNDWEKQRAIFKARVIISNGELLGEERGLHVFEAYGDADQTNCSEMVKKHYIRMAETRAIARALRWATNNASTAKEETEQGELNEEH